MDEFNLEICKKFLQLDKNTLDESILYHSEIFYRISEKLSILVSLKDEAKNIMETTHARLSIEYRNIAKHTGEKITEDYLKQKVAVDSEYQEKFDNYLASKMEVDLWASMKDAFLQKGFMLKLMGDLYVSNYFSINSVESKNTDEILVQNARQKLANLRNSTKDIE